MNNIGIIGLGFVGGAIYNSLIKKNINVKGYDKYKNGGIGTFNDILDTEILFIALPTLFNEETKEYDKMAINETIKKLNDNSYNGCIVLKSTVEPNTNNIIAEKYPNLCIVHNPEFLTARTALEDFENQHHIVLGKNKNDSKFNKIIEFYQTYFPNAKITECTSLEAESMKMYLNSFYAVKVQFFTEIYLACQKNGSNFDLIRDMMLENGWINKMHTNIPGPDGNISYGGMCFPKDTQALSYYMEKIECPNMVLKACIDERNKMRND